MEVTAELKERIYSLSPDKLEQLERFVDFLLGEAKRKGILDEDNRHLSDHGSDDQVEK